ncbi:hypothetical protein [Alphaproteobacteria bacterium endosymbiont of Tiliacea citrago]|uniref:tRNA (adenosine(37)-N6)-dimethylallyltransferase n=1 Tax=Alphaproteobacteria bacterium endosymbiont of Tiliacea citrago TaxID=3077944 RepID=UPI00313ACB4D
MLAIIGPTASGKSEIISDLISKNYSAVNFDSCQMYSGLETLKSTPTDLNEHYLYSYLNHENSSNVFEWGNKAKETIEKIIERKRNPILVGGTGLYLKSFINGIDNLPENTEIKNQVNEMPFLEMKKQLEKVDPIILKVYKDERRLKKALSYFLFNNQSILAGYQKHRYTFFEDKVTVLALIPKREVLLERIRKRLIRDFDEMVEEVKKFKLNAEAIIGFSEIRLLLCGNITKNQCIEKIEIRTRQYAKRQVTFIKNCLKVDCTYENGDQLKNFMVEYDLEKKQFI